MSAMCLKRKSMIAYFFDVRSIIIFIFYVFSSFSSVIANDFCFLTNGGSSETFTVNEAVPIDRVIGTLQVIGNVTSETGEPGNIELSLAPQSPHSRLDGLEVPIKIKPGTKDLVLIRKLDKEGVEGEHGIVIGVRCKKINQAADPSIIIPVRIIVTDANDHPPEFLGLPYVVNVSEVAMVGSPLVAAGKIRAKDDDQQGPFSTVEYYVEPGPYSHIAKFESQLGGALILTAPLDYETLPKFSIIVRTQDQGEPPLTATATVTVNVIDADDQNPRFMDDKYNARLADNNREGSQLLVSPKSIRAVDPDTDINSPIEYSFNHAADSREYSYFHIDPKFGEITLKKTLPQTMTFPITLVIRATQVDNRDRYALTTLTVFNRKQVMFVPDIRFQRENYTASVLENQPPGQVLLTVQTSRNDNREESIQFQILDDENGYFGIRKTGEIILKKSLDYEQRPWYSFRVMASDGKQSDVARINVTVLNVNDHDPQFSQNHYNFFVSEGRLRNTSVVGEVRATDSDSSDEIELSVKGPFAKTFTVTNDGLIKVKSLKHLNTSQCHLIVVATDNGKPPRSSSVPVTVQFAPNVLKAFSRNIDDLESFIARHNDAESKQNAGTGVDMNMIFNAGSSSALLLVIVLGVLLATLFIIIITLTVHVLKQKKFTTASVSSSSSDSSENASSPTHHSMPYNYNSASRRRSSSSITSLGKSSRVAPLPEGRTLFVPTSTSLTGFGMRGVENPIFNMPSTTTSNLNMRYHSSPPNSDPDSAIVSDASSNSRADNERDSGNKDDRSISPPPPPSVTCTGSTGGGTASRISVIKWPQGSIPRRVKKLTWEDERYAGAVGDRCIVRPVFNEQQIMQGEQQRCDNHIVNDQERNYESNYFFAANPQMQQNALQSEDQTQDQRGTELDPDVSVTPLRRTYHHQNSVESGLPDLTVYF